MTRLPAALGIALVLSGLAAPSGRAQQGTAPGGANAATARWDTAALAEVVRYAQAQKTTGFLIIEDRMVIAEHNWPPGAGAATFLANFVYGTAADGALLEDVASQQKSFVAILIGVAIDKGLLDLARPVSAYAGHRWSKASPEQEARITVRNLIEMNSGLKEDLTYDAEPGAKFFYNTPAYAITKKVLEAGARQSLDELTRRWLTAPVGMTDTSWRKRPAAFGDVGNPTGLVTTPRDIARMGQLVLDGGKAADGTRVISKAQLDAIFERSSTNPAYGRLWWLNGGPYFHSAGANAPRGEGSFIPAGPPDMVAALGALDRKLFVVSSRKLIVVRTGQVTGGDFNQQLWLRMMKALPAG
jgi:CubicO group peptidase (beta-lactamase class C family)